MDVGPEACLSPADSHPAQPNLNVHLLKQTGKKITLISVVHYLIVLGENIILNSANCKEPSYYPSTESGFGCRDHLVNYPQNPKKQMGMTFVAQSPDSILFQHTVWDLLGRRKMNLGAFCR
jgi:hypothetical protein